MVLGMLCWFSVPDCVGMANSAELESISWCVGTMKLALMLLCGTLENSTVHARNVFMSFGESSKGAVKTSCIFLAMTVTSFYDLFHFFSFFIFPFQE